MCRRFPVAQKQWIYSMYKSICDLETAINTIQQSGADIVRAVEYHEKLMAAIELLLSYDDQQTGAEHARAIVNKARGNHV